MTYCTNVLTFELVFLKMQYLIFFNIYIVCVSVHVCLTVV
jgi:hypothetical protein